MNNIIKHIQIKSYFTALTLLFFLTFFNLSAATDNLEKEIEVIEKLYKDGVLTKEEFEKTKKILIRNDKAKEEKNKNRSKPKIKDQSKAENNKKIKSSDIKVTIENKRKDSGYEKAEIIFKDYKIYTFRPGGIKVKIISDGKVLLIIKDNFKVKYMNNSKGIIEVDYSEMKRPGLKETTEHRLEQAKGKLDGLLDPIGGLKKYSKKLKAFSKSRDIDDIKFKRDYKSLIPKESIFLKLKIEGATILTADGRYVNHHDVFFYQFLTSTYEPFHYYIKLRSKPSIALNMKSFNKTVDKAVRKAKDRLSIEHNISVEQIDQIIEDKINRETDDAIESSIEDAVNQSVADAIEESVGAAMAESLVQAIESATGEAIDAALTQELGAAIDAEIARAVEMGIDEAAVTAGWEAYFSVIGAGGSAEEASAAAYSACGSSCDNY